jgi:glutathione-regulated potassium-efflux system ancillary protein KefG
MSKQRTTVRIDELIDAHEVQRILGLTHRNAVANYLDRYADMPRPVIDLGRGRARLWIRPEVERWQAKRESARKRP